ncbi:MAG: type II toxin-antitoxin system prevent-host-death family antitoxin [Thiothrix sp.]|nr:MAG: type II toxin-antitoxin system prevent-host-death family antitoxin [Thiothrix sp.]
MQTVEVFSARDLRNHSGELLRQAEQGNMTIITKHGRPSFLTIPFDENLLKYGVQRTLALLFVQTQQMTLAQAARFAGIDLEDFIELLGKSGINAVDYPADDLEAELEHVL